ncbi:IS701 family transposase [Streptomyces sp. NPDC102473]|uniref:IS701 family transposase n=1 Tax=Streptomyces sp. NPDC102473 TaxID=3366180 RepID=UPI00382B27FB
MGRKNSWQLAKSSGHPTPDGLQHLLAKSRWEADGIRDDPQGYVAGHLDTDEGILVIDDTGFIKWGTTSAGVQRQYSRTAGRTENCQIGVFAAYATTRGHALVDRELYLPKSWTDDPERCRAARMPESRPFATKNELARTLVLRAQAGPLPVTWVAAGAAYGQDSRLRRFLEDTNPTYVMAVSKSQQVHGPRIDHLIGQAPDEAWQRLSCGDGAKGPRLYDWAAARLPGVRRQRAHPATLDACPPQHHQGRRPRLLPRIRALGRHRHRSLPCTGSWDRAEGGSGHARPTSAA